MDLASAALEKVVAFFPDVVLSHAERCRQKFVNVKRDRIFDLLTFLKHDPDVALDMLMDLTALDYLNAGMPERFCVVYQLYSTRNNGSFRVKAYVPEADPTIRSVTSLWAAANWAEREVYDLYGIEFEGHPNLKRLMLPAYYTGHPLRKDYPLRGLGERDNFPRYEGGTS